MPFPELQRWFKRFLPDSEPIQLQLNLKSGLALDAQSVPDAQWLMRNGYYQIAAALGAGLGSTSGEVVNIDTALQHSVVWACNRIISESIGFMPAILMQDTPQGKRIATEHPMYRAMKMAPNAELTAQAFSEMLTSHCLLSGNGYAKIIRRSGTNTAIELQPLLPGQVVPSREKTGQKRLMYELKNEQGHT